MTTKLSADHLRRGAILYVRQSTLGQVVGHAEGRRRQYALADRARAMGFARVDTIDEDLGKSGSGAVERPGFQRLVAAVCAGLVGAIVCLEASRLARNGRDWHHLIDLCALVGTLVIDAEGIYDPRLLNDRLLLGLKGTMSEYELGLLRQRGLAARDAKAGRGELRYRLPPGYCWDELGRIDFDPDQRVVEAVRLVFRKFEELGSVRQVLLWLHEQRLSMPVVRLGPRGAGLAWCPPAYHNLLAMLRNPLYAGAYVFGRTGTRTSVVDGRARTTGGHRRPREQWSVLLRDRHPGYITWEQFEHNQLVVAENAHMKKRASRKSGRGGRALVTGLARCGRCGRMLRVFYGSRSGHAHRYQCRGDDMRGATGQCLGVGGVRVDRAVSAQLVQAVAPYAVEAALRAAERAGQANDDARAAVARELDEARYDVTLASRRYEAVDPAKRLVAAELEARWEAALGRVREVEGRLAALTASATPAPRVDRAQLSALAGDLTAVWNSPSADMRTKQRIVRLLVREVVVTPDQASREVSLAIHWVGGHHTEVRVARVRTGRYPADRAPSAVEAMRKMGGRWPDRDVAMAMNRMRCKSEKGGAWTETRVRALRERLAIAPFDPSAPHAATVSMDEAAHRLGVCVASVRRLVREGILPATQVMPSAPWQIPTEALTSDVVRRGVQGVEERRRKNGAVLRQERTLKLPGV
jgi:DNA invertase Pin-like site-specific DNA recombinase